MGVKPSDQDEARQSIASLTPREYPMAARAQKPACQVSERELLDALLEHSPDRIYFKDRESRFVRLSRAQAEKLGLSDPVEAVNKTDFDFFTEEHAFQAFSDEEQIMASGMPIIGKEEKETWPDGRETWVSTTKAPLRGRDGQIIGTMGISRDITARLLAERQLEEYRYHLEELIRVRTSELERKAQELDRSNRSLEQFAYVASHDLQEPLRIVASYTQLLSHRYKGKLDADADEFIAYAVDGANRMRQLIEDLLSYSRVRSCALALGPCSSQAACYAALANLRQAVLDAGAEITSDSLPVVFADPRELSRVFQNLIGNAIKYRQSGRSSRIHISAVEEGNLCVFSVADNGIGIEPQYFDRIFGMFQRLHSRTEYSGTGIGLAICRDIVERHGGRIWVESRPHEGSTFRFTVLRTEEKARAASQTN